MDELVQRWQDAKELPVPGCHRTALTPRKFFSANKLDF